MAKRVKVVVTGGAGFIGSHVVERWLAEDAEVHIIDNLRSGFLSNVELFPAARFHYGSITDRDLVFRVIKGADYVHHLAAFISVPESVENPAECIEINVNGFLNLLDAAKEFGIKKVVFSSSAAVYGDNPASPKETGMAPAPKSPYGITKLDGEYYLKMYNELYGLGGVSLRYFNVFGPRQNPNSQYAAAVPVFISRALKNEPVIIYGDGNQTRDFVYAKDVAEANYLAATKEEVNGVFNIGVGRSTSIKDLAEMIIKLTGSLSKIKYEAERAGDIRESVASVDETKRLLEFEPIYTLEEGLKTMLNV